MKNICTIYKLYESGMTQTQISVIVNISQATVNRYIKSYKKMNNIGDNFGG